MLLLLLELGTSNSNPPPPLLHLSSTRNRQPVHVSHSRRCCPTCSWWLQQDVVLLHCARYIKHWAQRFGFLGAKCNPKPVIISKSGGIPSLGYMVLLFHVWQQLPTPSPSLSAALFLCLHVITLHSVAG